MVDRGAQVLGPNRLILDVGAPILSEAPVDRRANAGAGEECRETNMPVQTPGCPWVLIRGDRPNSPTTTTRVRSSRPRSLRSVRSAAALHRDAANTSPFVRTGAKALPMPMWPPCMSQLDIPRLRPRPDGTGPDPAVTLTQLRPASTSRRAKEQVFAPSGCRP